MRRTATCFLVGLLLLAGATASAQTADDWQSLRAVYDYDAEAPLEISAGQVRDLGAFRVEELTFAGAGGERVPAVVMRPTEVQEPPVVLFLHGLGGDKGQARLVAMLLAPQGVAVVAIDAALHGDRAVEGPGIGRQLAADPQALVRTVIDNRRAIDYIHIRGDLDADRLVLVGASMGAILGSIVAAVDERIDAAALLVGGGGWTTILESSEHPAAAALRDAGLSRDRSLGQMDPVHFVGHISPRPVLMVNGTQDRVIPPQAAEALHEAARQPKEVLWYEGGHVGMPPETLQRVVEWIATRLALVEAPTN
ncbi:MAG: alpha/beta hydrolase [Armatimonadota bacterium]|nr:alpha/beta hydrolase [Armatimonadota bacterium]